MPMREAVVDELVRLLHSRRQAAREAAHLQYAYFVLARTVLGDEDRVKPLNTGRARTWGLRLREAA